MRKKGLLYTAGVAGLIAAAALYATTRKQRGSLTVQEGESFRDYAIAEGLTGKAAERWAKIMALENQLENANIILPGQELKYWDANKDGQGGALGNERALGSVKKDQIPQNVPVDDTIYLYLTGEGDIKYVGYGSFVGETKPDLEAKAGYGPNAFFDHTASRQLGINREKVFEALNNTKFVRERSKYTGVVQSTEPVNTEGLTRVTLEDFVVN